MQSLRVKGPMRLLLMTSIASCVAACAPKPYTPIIPVAPTCSRFVPQSVRADVAPADLPSDNSVGAYAVALADQTDALEEEQGRKRAALTIIEECEAEAAERVEKLKKEIQR